ncbi:FACT complex subunit ssrp1 [Cichlidogyrus casuarinus]|uniref:FACT complex subunit SSRP1 n=1 Tax=Cichlidogyrus casuarinus TaxID=1844966 RepID=A0ABD2QJ46_9PLAT
MISAEWIARAMGSCLRLKLKNGELHRYDAFRESDIDKVSSFFKKHYDIDIVKKELCYKGMNFGDIEFNGNTMELRIDDAMAFELPMDIVYNATTKNNEEVIIELNQDDDAGVCLSELRLFSPAQENKDVTADLIYQKIKRRAGILEATGDSLVQFSELSCLQPRGRYEFKFFPTFIHLHGKSYDFKVPKTSLLRVMLLPDVDERTHFVVVNVQPPLKLGQTNYHFIIVQFENDNYVDVEMNCTESFLEEKYGDKLSKRLNGPAYQIVSNLFHSLYGIKITVPGSFTSKMGLRAVSCNYKTSHGLLYPLDKGFMFVPKPAIFIRLEEIVSIQFSRGSSLLKSFDLEIETRNGLSHTFTALVKREYETMYNFVSKKNLNVKNIESETNQKASILEDWSEEEDEPHDAYLQQVKAEGKANAARDSDDESEDEDFKPPEDSGSEVQDEFESNPSSTDESSDGGKSSASDKSSPKKKKKSPTKSKPQSKVAAPSKRKGKDPNMPSRPPTAFMLWLNENRPKISKELGSNSSVTEVAKRAGELWKEMTSSDKEPYNEKVARAKEEYEIKMKEYKRRVASGEIIPQEVAPKSKKAKTNSAPKKTKTTSSSNIKTSEFVKSDEDLSSLSSAS